jgi:hypothetical protein
MLARRAGSIDIESRVPMGRFATADDVADVDGGWTADGGWDSLRLRNR